MKAIVTGGAGFIGSHIVDFLLSQEIETVVIDNYSTGRPQNLFHHKGNKRLHLIQGDLSDEQLDLDSLVAGADYIFHFAALADIVPSVRNPEFYYQANVHGTFRLLQAARKVPGLRKLIYPASSTCYGFPESTPTPETAPIDTQFPYALTKYMGEELVMHWSKLYKLPCLSLRFFNVYGPRARTSGTYGAVFGVFLAQKLAGHPYTVVGDGQQTRDFTYVSDIVSAVWAAAESPLSHEIFNVGSGQTYSINRLVELLQGPKTFIPKRPGEPYCTFADISKIRRLLGWGPKVSFEQGVKAMLGHIDYWREAPVWTPETIAAATREWFEALR